MHRKPRPVTMTPRQMAETIIALRSHIATLSKQEDEDRQGGEVEDMLIAQSVIKHLEKAAADAYAEDYPGLDQPGTKSETKGFDAVLLTAKSHWPALTKQASRKVHIQPPPHLIRSAATNSAALSC